MRPMESEIRNVASMDGVPNPSAQWIIRVVSPLRKANKRRKYRSDWAGSRNTSGEKYRTLTESAFSWTTFETGARSEDADVCARMASAGMPGSGAASKTNRGLTSDAKAQLILMKTRAMSVALVNGGIRSRIKRGYLPSPAFGLSGVFTINHFSAVWTSGTTIVCTPLLTATFSKNLSISSAR